MSISFRDAFDSTFHNKLSFDDFLNIDVEHNYKVISFNDRKILSPSGKLKKYHQFINKFIFEYASVNTRVLHSYMHGRNTYTAVSKHAKSQCFFQTDIRDFFNSLSRQDVENVINYHLSDIPIYDIEKYKDHLLRLVIVDGVIPVGFSTSPGISNTCLYHFDNKLEEYCQRHSVVYTRYSDDLIFSAGSCVALDNVQTMIEQQLDAMFSQGLQLNLKKTKLIHKGQKIKLLGLVILPSGHVSVDRNFKQHLEILLHFYVNDKVAFYDYLRNKYKGSCSKISGQLNYINMIDKSYLDKLRKKYGNFVVDGFYNNTIE